MRQTDITRDAVLICASHDHSSPLIPQSEKAAPNKAYIRVIRHGALGPVTELAIAKDREHPLWTDNMVLHAQGERIWFVNTLAPNTLHEFKLVDTTSP